MMDKLMHKNIKQPDESRPFPKGKVDLVKINGMTIGQATFEPGWKWSESVKPMAGTESCQMTHTGYQISGRLHVKMDDGTEAEFGPGDVSHIPPGHDGWVVGDEPVVVIDISGMKDYAKTA